MQSSSALPRVKSQASISLLESVPDLPAIENASQIVQNISDPRGLASIICLERYGKIEAPSVKSSETEELESCLYTPTEEDICGAETIWREVISADIEHTFIDYNFRKRKWKRALQKARISASKTNDT